ncbi:MAG: hypothetical protein HY293_19185 [Planctomycetes bacterium]|nr:hypothetical protein [Planctomycetota bacterium]
MSKDPLEAALAGARNGDLQARLKEIVAELDSHVAMRTAQFQQLRAIRRIELAGARGALEGLAGSSPAPRVEREAARAAARLPR